MLGVGDLHVENFGTWRDAEGRLIWGINDFDEACPMPYTIDLVRLAASADLAIKRNTWRWIPIKPARQFKGYEEGWQAAASPSSWPNGTLAAGHGPGRAPRPGRLLGEAGQGAHGPGRRSAAR